MATDREARAGDAMKRKLTTFAIAIDGNEPPTEFRIFRAGENTNRNGDSVLFDDVAAKTVMGDYERHGVDIMIDLEHLSLDETAPNFDPDARGWTKLALRPAEDPQPGAASDCWAVDVRWTPEGATRLRQRKQRYISPAFDTDTKRRVTYIANIAITGMPATDRLTPLMAARINIEDDDPKEEERIHMKALLAMLGLAEGADAAAVQAAITALTPEQMAAFVAALMAAETAEDAAPGTVLRENDPPRPPAPAPVLPMPTQHRAKPPADDTSDALAAELVTLNRRVNERDLRDVLEAAKRDGKTTPALEKWSLAKHGSDVNAARDYWNIAPVIAPPPKTFQEPALGERGPGKGDTMVLPKREESTIRHFARRMGNNPDAVVKFRRDELATQRQKNVETYERAKMDLAESFGITEGEG